jgi:tetratricopeptide (TPR) repeat protein
MTRMNPDDETRLEDIGCEAQRLAKAGEWQQANELVLSIPDADELTGYLHEKAIALTDIGRAMLKTGQRELASSTLADAERVAHVLARGGTWEEAYQLYDIGCVWQEAGEGSEALRLWDSALDAAGRGLETYRLLATLARQFRDLGLHERVRKAVAHLPPEYPWEQLPRSPSLGE